jgi:transposase
MCLGMHDRDVNAAKNIRMMGLADSLGLNDCVKSSSITTLVSASAKYLRRSSEAPNKMNLFI